MKKHYTLTNETIQHEGKTLYQIKATKDLPHHNVKAGDLGGFVEGYHNLDGEAWVAGNAKVYENAQVFGKAWVYGNAWVSGDAWIFGDAQVFGNAWVFGDAQVFENAWVSGNAYLYRYARVSGDARIFGYASVFGNAHIVDSKIEKTNDYFVVQGFRFPITITPQVITIGCQTRSRFGKEQWKTVTKQQAIEMGLPEYEYEGIKEMLKVLRTRVKRKKS